MSTSPYSVDLRRKVIKYLEEGHSQDSAAKVFSIHKNTVSRWWLRYKKLGILEPKARPGAKRKVDVGALELYVRNNADVRLKDIALKFSISTCRAHFWLKQLNFSYKKNFSLH